MPKTRQGSCTDPKSDNEFEETNANKHSLKINTKQANNIPIIHTNLEMEPETGNSSNNHTTLVDLNTLFKFVKPFDGDRDKLLPFLNTVDSAFNIATQDQATILLAYTKAQLSGKAESACSNHVFNDWESLKTYLKSLYADKKHYGHLLMELLNCRQEETETIAQFMVKLETILKRVLSSTQQINRNPTELPGRLAAMNDIALHTFILNVKSNISQMLRARNIETLNEAFNFALEEEKIQLLIKEQRQSRGKQNINFHAKHYYKPTNPQITNKTIQNPSFKPMFNVATPKFCRYCRYSGHDINECRKKKYNDQNFQNRSKFSQPNSSVNSGNLHFLEPEAVKSREENQLTAQNLN